MIGNLIASVAWGVLIVVAFECLRAAINAAYDVWATGRQLDAPPEFDRPPPPRGSGQSIEDWCDSDPACRCRRCDLARPIVRKLEREVGRRW